jgi:hypothetical protein
VDRHFSHPDPSRQYIRINQNLTTIHVTGNFRINLIRIIRHSSTIWTVLQYHVCLNAISIPGWSFIKIDFPDWLYPTIHRGYKT